MQGEEGLKDKNKYSTMIQNNTIPSLSGPFGIPSRPVLNPKCQKSLQARPTITHRLSSINEQIENRIEQGQRTTHGIFHSGRGFGFISGNFKYIYLGN